MFDVRIACGDKDEQSNYFASTYHVNKQTIVVYTQLFVHFSDKINKEIRPVLPSVIEVIDVCILSWTC